MNNVHDECCFCFKLRTGSLIVGYLSLVYVIGEMIYQTVNLLTFEAPKDVPDIDARTMKTFLYIMFGMMMFMCVLYLAFTITLIVGLHQHKPKHVLAFIKFQYFLIGMSIIGFFRYFSYFDLASFCINLFSMIITIYFVIVLKSYHEKMVVVGNGVIYNVA